MNINEMEEYTQGLKEKNKELEEFNTELQSTIERLEEKIKFYERHLDFDYIENIDKNYIRKDKVNKKIEELRKAQENNRERYKNETKDLSTSELNNIQNDFIINRNLRYCLQELLEKEEV